MSAYCNSDFKAILGENYGETEYGNLIAGNKKAVKFYVQNKETAEITQVTGYENKWGVGKNSRIPMFVVNENPKAICDFIGGEKNRDSYNFLVDLSMSEPINKAVFAAGAGKSFYPTRLNVYLSDSEEEIFAKDARPTVVFTSRNDDGVYSAEFEPRRTRFVRFEVEDTENDYFGGKIITVVSNIAVFGALNAAQETFGLDLQKKMLTAKEKPVSVMSPYLCKIGGAWVNTEYKATDSEILKEISRDKVGDNYLRIALNSQKILDMGVTNVPSLISTAEDLPDLSIYNKVYFYVKLANSDSFGSGKIKIQVVSRAHKFYLVPFILEPDKWTKIDISEFFDIVAEDGLRRFAIYADDGSMNTEIIVGSLQAVKTVDPGAWGVDINSVADMTPETVPEDLKKKLSQYNISI